MTAPLALPIDDRRSPLDPTDADVLGHGREILRAEGHAVLGMADALDRALAGVAPDPCILADAAEPYRIGPIADAHLDVFDRVYRARTAGAAALTERFADQVAYI